MRNLINIPIRVGAEKFDINGFTVVKGKYVFVAQAFCGFIDGFIIQPGQDPALFCDRQLRFYFFLDQFFRVEFCELGKKITENAWIIFELDIFITDRFQPVNKFCFHIILGDMCHFVCSSVFLPI